MGELVTREDKDGLCWLTLNRPDKLNALNVHVFEELRAHIIALQSDEAARVVIIRGAGRCFSAGHDLADLAEGEVTPSPFWHSETLRMLEKLPKPVIAAVHGHCYTGALEVALAADFILASANAKFADTHAKWSLTPLWGMSQRLPRRVGLATAKKLMFTAETLNAEEALRIGLCEAVYADDVFYAEVEALARRILANASFSHAAFKRLLEASDTVSLDTGLHREVFDTEGFGPDMQDRIAAFLRK